jgi:hypothetical protein
MESPMTWDNDADPATTVANGLLSRCRETQTCPKIVQTVSDTEYWQSAMSSDTTETAGRVALTASNDQTASAAVAASAIAKVAGVRDLSLPDNVRLYHLASTQHGGYSAVGPVPPILNPMCQQLPNINSYTYNLRAILIALKNWVVDNKVPPTSRYPKISDGTLVEYTKIAFPKIPRVSANFDVLVNRRTLYNRGSEFDGSNISGYESAAPPIPVMDYPAFVPQVDSDGNDVGGVHSLSLMVPLGTYTAWNTRSAGFSEGDSCDLIGSFIPLPKTPADAAFSGDPRKPIASRYPSAAAYHVAVEAAARTLVTQGFLLASDEASAVSQAKAQAHGSGLLPP